MNIRKRIYIIWSVSLTDKENYKWLLISASIGKRNIHMDRETVLQNIMVNYGKYGITEDMVNEVIDACFEGGMSYELIYSDICRKISEITGEEFYCTSSDMARAFGVSEDEMNRIIEEAREELIEASENPDEYFKTVETTRFMV